MRDRERMGRPPTAPARTDRSFDSAISQKTSRSGMRRLDRPLRNDISGTRGDRGTKSSHGTLHDVTSESPDRHLTSAGQHRRDTFSSVEQAEGTADPGWADHLCDGAFRAPEGTSGSDRRAPFSTARIVTAVDLYRGGLPAYPLARVAHDYSAGRPAGRMSVILHAVQQIGSIMKFTRFLPAVALLSVLGATDVMADCQIADAKLEEAILQKPELRVPANRQIVRDLRSLRDAAFTLWSYGRHDDCERLLANIRELVAQPLMSTLGGNDEEEADKQISALEPKVQRGAAQGHRDAKGAKPLMNINEMAPGLRADEIIGAEVRSSDDKIIGEVRNIVFGTKDRRDYAIVASGGFFTTGKDSIVVPIRFLKVSEERTSFFLPMREAQVKTVPLMPDQDYEWLADEAWRARNDALFSRP